MFNNLVQNYSKFLTVYGIVSGLLIFGIMFFTCGIFFIGSAGLSLGGFVSSLAFGLINMLNN